MEETINFAALRRDLELEAAVRSLETTAGAADRLYQADLARRRARKAARKAQ